MAFDLLQPEYLFRLARSGTPQDKSNLAQAVIGFMHGDLNTNERAIAEDILLQLLREVETEMRMALADKLAHEPECSKELLDFLIYENPHEVSASILQYSQALNDEYLIEIVQHFEDTEYWQSIARRKEVSENVTRYLIGTDDKDVYRILVKNRGAQFCPISIEWMVNVASSVPDLQGPLISRPEVTPELAAKLYWHVSSELRFQITSRFDINIKQVDALLDKMVKYRLAQRENEVVISADVYELAQQMKLEHGITSHQLLEALQKDKIPLFFCLWGSLLNLNPELIGQKIKENAAENLAILCKTARITARHYNVLFLLWRRNDRKGRPGMDLSAALAFYSALTLQQAQEAIASWNIPDDNSRTIH